MYIKQERFKAVKLRSKLFALVILSGLIPSETVFAQPKCTVTEKFFSIFKGEFSSLCGNNIVKLDHGDIVLDATYFDNEQSDLLFRDSAPGARDMIQVAPLSANQQLNDDRGLRQSSDTSSTQLATPTGFSTLKGSANTETKIRK